MVKAVCESLRRGARLIPFFLFGLLVPLAVAPGAGRPDGFSMKRLERTWRAPSDTSRAVTLRVEYPEFDTGRRANDTLNGFIQETLLGKADRRGVEPVLRAVLDTVAGEYRESLKSDPAHYWPWIIERRITVLDDTLGVLTLQVKEFRDKGGAPPTTMCLLYMIERATMKSLSLDDLVPSEKHPVVRGLAEAEFRRVRKIPAGTKLKDAGFSFPDDVFVLSMNVGLSPNGLLFLYNPFEVAAPEMGATEVCVPWSMLKDLIRRGHGIGK